MQHVTQGRLDRYTKTAMMLRPKEYLGWLAAQPAGIGRRAMLKSLRDFMSPKRNHAARTEERRRRDVARRFPREPQHVFPKGGRIAWVDESAALPDREINGGDYRVQLRASGKSEAFNEFMARKLGIEVTP